MDKRVDLLGEDLHRAAIQVENVEALLYTSAGDSRAGWESQTHQQLVGDDVGLDKALLSGCLEDLIDFQHTQSLDVDGAAFLVGLVIVVRVYTLNSIELCEVEVL